MVGAFPFAHRISGARLRKDVEHISREYPTRIAGTQAAQGMARYSAAELTAAGAAGRVVQVPGLVSFPDTAHVTLLGPQALRLDAMTAGHAASTPPGGVEATIVDAGGGSAAELARAGVAGKFVLADLALAPARTEKHRLARMAGAAGLITTNWGPQDGVELPSGSVKSVWGNPGARDLAEVDSATPVVGVSRRDGLALAARLKAGASIRANIVCKAETGWHPVHYTVGELAGQSDDFVLVGGHQDAWLGPASTDNATGSACMLELARVFSELRPQLRRGLRFGFWAGHETGCMLSSADYADANWDLLRDHAVAYLQIDQPGCAGASVWSGHSNLQLRAFQEQVDRMVMGDRPRRWRRSTKIGDASFLGLGVPMFASLGGFPDDVLKANGNATFGWWHHTPCNTLDKVDFEDLQAHVRAYAGYLWNLCCLPALPFDFTEPAQAMAARLRQLAVGDDLLQLEQLARRCDQFGQQAVRLKNLVIDCNAADAGSRAQPDADVHALNQAQKRLNQLLLGVESSVAERHAHDPYGLSEQATVLPGLHGSDRLATLPEGQERWVLQTDLRRARNRLSDLLEQAIETVRPLVGAPGG
jgi:hypothetical protein